MKIRGDKAALMARAAQARRSFEVVCLKRRRILSSGSMPYGAWWSSKSST